MSTTPDTTNTSTVVAQYAVVGMTCGHCEHAVTTEMQRIDGVDRVAVDLASGIVTVAGSRHLKRDEVAQAVDAAGYELAS